MFETPMELHYSQTAILNGFSIDEFETPMELHYSQTQFENFRLSRSV